MSNVVIYLNIVVNLNMLVSKDEYFNQIPTPRTHVHKIKLGKNWEFNLNF